MDKNIISKAIVKAMNKYIGETGDVKPEDLEAFKNDLKNADEIISKFKEHYNIC